jgi:stage IV sporulation protein B
MAFGVKYYAEGAIVIGVCDVETTTGLASPARDAGLAKGDVITHACGSKIKTLEDLLTLVEGCGGQKIEIGYTRNGTANKLTLAPVKDRNNGKYRLGVWVRDSTAGIGTVTYVVKETLEFGGLGHGINDSSTGMLMPFGSGTVVEVTIDDIKKGMKNAPGELKGTFTAKELGTLSRNTEAGVFGTLEYLPEAGTKTIPVGSAADVKTGKATVRSCAGGTVRDYEIEIEEIYTPAGKTKNFLIHVTDPQLIALTGGIVQGMSGSPIIQNGKLIGAVTHVLVNDPTRGYGIFIENMLEQMG